MPSSHNSGPIWQRKGREYGRSKSARTEAICLHMDMSHMRKRSEGKGCQRPLLPNKATAVFELVLWQMI